MAGRTFLGRLMILQPSSRCAICRLVVAQAFSAFTLSPSDRKRQRDFGLIVVFVHGDRELDFFEGDHFLLFARGALALFFLVEKTAVVLDAAHRRDGGGRYFHEIKAALAGNLQRLERLKDSKLFAIFVDDANFARANAIVDADERLSCSFIESDGSPPKVCRAGCVGRAPAGCGDTNAN